MKNMCVVKKEFTMEFIDSLEVCLVSRKSSQKQKQCYCK